jgi:hypothetical protein
MAAVALAVALAVGACTAGGATPTWTFAPGSSAASAATPVPTATVIPATPAPTSSPTPVAATSAAPPTATPTPSDAPSYQPGLTDEEWAPFATTWGIQHATVDSPLVSAARAEEIVRERYPGNRPLVWSGPVTYGEGSRVGWMVVLGIAPGQACALHPGLLDRALEGGIVDAATGEIFFTMTCG